MRLNTLSNAGSFSDKIKEEICSAPPKKQCCRRAFIFGVILGSRYEDGETILISANKSAQKELLQKLIKEQFGREASIKDLGGKAEHFSLSFNMPVSFKANTTDEVFYKSLMKCQECSQAFFGGVFFVSGSINSPDKEYYLQFGFPSEERMMLARSLFGEAGMPLACSIRRENAFLYTRASSVIEDFLALVHSPKAYFELINSKIIKDLRNNANRRANCDTANITKSVGAAQKVMAAIKKLEAAGRLLSLPPELEEAARLRLENPQASIERLGLIANPSVTKSGMNHRLNKLMKIADELK